MHTQQKYETRGCQRRLFCYLARYCPCLKCIPRAESRGNVRTPVRVLTKTFMITAFLVPNRDDSPALGVLTTVSNGYLREEVRPAFIPVSGGYRTRSGRIFDPFTLSLFLRWNKNEASTCSLPGSGCNGHEEQSTRKQGAPRDDSNAVSHKTCVDDFSGGCPFRRADRRKIHFRVTAQVSSDRFKALTSSCLRLL